MTYQTCRRHPAAGRFLATCSGCAQELHDIQYAPATATTPAAAENAFWDHAENCIPCFEGRHCDRGAGLWRALEQAQAAAHA